MIRKETIPAGQDQYKFGMGIKHEETVSSHCIRGEVFMELRDAATGELLESRHQQNLIVLDAGILISILLKDKASRPFGLNMLAIGSGATGALLSPDAADNRQRKLNAEISRKAFSSTVYRDASGNAVAYPTNIVDYVTVFGESEAVGALNEMMLLSTISSNPSIHNNPTDIYPARDTTEDMSAKDVAANRLTFGVLVKPSSAILSITWRLTA